MNSKNLGSRLCLFVLVAFLSACAIPKVVGPRPAYYFDTVYLNQEVGPVHARKKVPNVQQEVVQAKQVVIQKQVRTQHRAKNMAKALDRRRAVPSQGAPEVKSPHDSGAQASGASEENLSVVATASEDMDSTEPSPIVSTDDPSLIAESNDDGLDDGREKGLVLGDGSIPEELLASAKRLLGMQGAFSERPFLAHLLSAAAIDLPVSASRSRYASEVWRYYADIGRADSVESVGNEPEVGRLAFFRSTFPSRASSDEGSASVAVVEQIDSSGVIRCIGEVHGTVVRFPMNPTRPWVYRDETDGQVINAVIGHRRLDEDPDRIPLAGALLMGYATP